MDTVPNDFFLPLKRFQTKFPVLFKDRNDLIWQVCKGNQLVDSENANNRHKRNPGEPLSAHLRGRSTSFLWQPPAGFTLPLSWFLPSTGTLLRCQGARQGVTPISFHSPQQIKQGGFPTGPRLRQESNPIQPSIILKFQRPNQAAFSWGWFGGQWPFGNRLESEVGHF